MRRGDLVTIATQGDDGKPGPALIVQSDLFSGRPPVAILPVTGELRPALAPQIRLDPNDANGLQRPSDGMVDKLLLAALVREIDRPHRGAIHVQFEDIGTSVMPACIELSP